LLSCSPEYFHLPLRHFSITSLKEDTPEGEVLPNLRSNKRGRNSHRPAPWNRFAEFFPIPSEELSYLIGAYMGDGSIYRAGGNAFLRLGAKDKEFVEFFAININKLLHRRPSVRLTSKGLYQTRIASKSLCNYLERGLLRLSPSIDAYPSSFIRGLADSDGSALVTTARMRGKPWFFVQVVVATTPDLRLLTFVKKLLWKHFGLFATIVFKGRPQTRVWNGRLFRSRKRVFDLRISRFDDVKRFSTEIGFGLRRKQRKLECATKVRTQHGSGGVAVKEWFSGWRLGPREWMPRVSKTNVLYLSRLRGP